MTAKHATVARHGVIVATMVDEHEALTVTFRRDTRVPRLGFDVTVVHSKIAEAKRAHDAAVLKARHVPETVKALHRIAALAERKKAASLTR